MFLGFFTGKERGMLATSQPVHVKKAQSVSSALSWGSSLSPTHAFCNSSGELDSTEFMLKHVLGLTELPISPKANILEGKSPHFSERGT